MKGRLAKPLIVNSVLVAIALIFLSPLIYIVLNSFKPTEEIFAVPQSILPINWTLDAYREIAGSRVVQYFRNSGLITLFSVIAVIVLSSLAGYGFAKLPFRGSDMALVAIVGTLTLPLAILLVPIFLMENSLGLLSTNLGLILPNIAVTLPFAILIMRASFIAIPQEIEEAGVMDGANALTRWRMIMLPMARNGVVLVTVITSYNVWGEYILAKTLAMNPDSMPLSVGLTLMKGEVWDFGLLAAVIVLATLPPVLLFILFQGKIVQGISQGAVKG